MSYKSTLTIILLALFHCASPQVKEKGHPDEKWLDNHTLHIAARGAIPFPPRDPTTNKLLACQNGRTIAIKKFHDRYMMPEEENKFGYSRKYSSSFHRQRIEIQTYTKSYDREGNCTLTIQFQSKNLKTRIHRKK